jgi:hypothetical protein
VQNISFIETPKLPGFYAIAKAPAAVVHSQILR